MRLCVLYELEMKWVGSPYISTNRLLARIVFVAPVPVAIQFLVIGWHLTRSSIFSMWAIALPVYLI